MHMFLSRGLEKMKLNESTGKQKLGCRIGGKAEIGLAESAGRQKLGCRIGGKAEIGLQNRLEGRNWAAESAG